MQVVGLNMSRVNGDLPEIWSRESGDRPYLKAIGESSNAPAGRFPHMTEVAPHFQEFDPVGSVWGRSGHFPLMIAVGTRRTYSLDATRQRVTRDIHRRTI